MQPRVLPFGAASLGIVIVPLLFESYTFYLYTIAEPIFFAFAGSRLWVFLASELALGYIIGQFCGKIPLYIRAGTVGTAAAVLVIVLYRFCEPRQCYYPGPDGMGGIRLGTILIAAAMAGLLIGESPRLVRHGLRSRLGAVLFGAITLILLGYYPIALVHGIFMTREVAIAMLAFASTAPFLACGAVSYLLNQKNRCAIYSSTAGWIVLFALFSTLRPSAIPLSMIILAAGIPLSLAGFRLAALCMSRFEEERASALIFLPVVALFVLGQGHPYIDAPMNLSIDREQGVLPEPSYYAGGYQKSVNYFPTKRVEVTINLEQAAGDGIEMDHVLAGMGVQSPNCCKDGLDYGYRADVLLKGSERSLVARAWETCDQNIACSGFPWISLMHQAEVPFVGETSSVMLAMEWQQDDRAVSWYYKTQDGNWTRYSSFAAPTIENPYFNLGVIWVGNPLSNPNTGKAFFYQTGVSVPAPADSFGNKTITFECPAYYDSKGVRECAGEMFPIENGNSHWKVLWKWGAQHESSAVTTEGSELRVRLG
jgi:hypothetical protein